jgi:hypothetical protein
MILLSFLPSVRSRNDSWLAWPVVELHVSDINDTQFSRTQSPKRDEEERKKDPNNRQALVIQNYAMQKSIGMVQFASLTPLAAKPGEVYVCTYVCGNLTVYGFIGFNNSVGHSRDIWDLCD